MPHPDIMLFPDCIIDSAGLGFALGAIGGSPYHFIKGLYSWPNGRRLAAGAQAVRISAPCVGGSLAAYCGLIEAFRFAMVSACKKDDFWSFVLPGFATGMCLPVGRGPRTVGISALAGLSTAAAVYGERFWARHIRYTRPYSPPPLEDPGLTPPLVIDSGPSGYFDT